MSISHEQYLNKMLLSKREELKEQKIRYRVFLAEHDIKLKLLNEQIDSIEHQLQANSQGIVVGYNFKEE